MGEQPIQRPCKALKRSPGGGLVARDQKVQGPTRLWKEVCFYPKNNEKPLTNFQRRPMTGSDSQNLVVAVLWRTGGRGSHPNSQRVRPRAGA